jgi:hypothetical protein
MLQGQVFSLFHRENLTKVFFNDIIGLEIKNPRYERGIDGITPVTCTGGNVYEKITSKNNYSQQRFRNLSRKISLALLCYG